MRLRRCRLPRADAVLVSLVLLAFAGVSCSGGGSSSGPKEELPPFEGNAIVNPELGFGFGYPDGWVEADPCAMPLTPFKPCTGSLYRPVSPGEQDQGIAGPLLFEATLSSPGDPEQGILGAVTGQGRPFEGVYFAVRRLQQPVASEEYLEAMRTRLPSVIRAAGASLIEVGSRKIGGADWLWTRYELKSWGSCIYLGAGGCVLATGRAWDQAFLVRGDILYLVSCEGSAQRSRLSQAGPPTLEPFSLLQDECQAVFESFRLTGPQSIPTIPAGKTSEPSATSPTATVAPTPRANPDAPNLAPNPSFEVTEGQTGWQFIPDSPVDAIEGRIDTEFAHTGTHSLAIKGTVFLNQSGKCLMAKGSWSPVSPIQIDRAKSYVLSIWHRGEVIGTSAGSASVHDALHVFFISNSGVILSERNIGVTSLEPGWVVGSLSISPPYPEGATQVVLALSAIFSFSVRGSEMESCPVGETLSLWYDDIAFQEGQ